MGLQATVDVSVHPAFGVVSNVGQTLDDLLSAAWGRVSSKLSTRFGDAILQIGKTGLVICKLYWLNSS